MFASPKTFLVSKSSVTVQKRNFAVGNQINKTQHAMKTEENAAVGDIFSGKKVILIGVPGAFTPVCSSKHVPSFVKDFEKLKKKGVDAVYCVSVNDAFTMKAWKESMKANNVSFLADWNGSFTKGIGMDVDLSAAGLGVRSKRYAIVVDNGKVIAENVEKSPGECTVTSAEGILATLN